MMIPNYRDFRKGSRFIFGSEQHLEHSAKGSTWEEHKYIKRIDGTYYYPDSYEGGRHISDMENGDDSDKEKKDKYGDAQKDSFGVKLSEVEQGVYDYMKNNLKDVDPKEVSEETWKKFIKEYVKFVGGDPNNIPDDIIGKVQKNVTEHYKNENNSPKLNDKDYDNLTKEVIRGNFGNGDIRKELLGENYAEVQKRVNELMKGSTASKKVSDVSADSLKKMEEAAKKASTSSSDSKVHSGVDMDKVMSVYKKKK